MVGRRVCSLLFLCLLSIEFSCGGGGKATPDTAPIDEGPATDTVQDPGTVPDTPDPPPEDQGSDSVEPDDTQISPDDGQAPEDGTNDLGGDDGLEPDSSPTDSEPSDSSPVEDISQDTSCTPDCEGKSCGDDGCGGNCGLCTESEICDPTGTCVCQPQCEGKECGDDGCGGDCGACGGTAATCTAEGLCSCTPVCDDKTCGDDGCEGNCGSCEDGLTCIEGDCLCVPDCTDKTCGDDGCGSSCGLCDAGLTCVEGGCICLPECVGKNCGDDSCGSTCGTCADNEFCHPAGLCVCIPDCEGKVCGGDGCDGNCGGDCGFGQQCSPEGQCVCAPQCDGLDCGPDSCGGSCGICSAGNLCTSDSQCAPVGSGFCFEPYPVGQLPYTVTRDTTGANSGLLFYEGECEGELDDLWGGNAGEHVYRFTAPGTGTFTVTLHPTAWDSVLYVAKECSNIEETCIIANEQPGNGTTEEVDFEMEAGTSVDIMVDGWWGNLDLDFPWEGSYNLTIDWACIPQCDGKNCGPDGCGESCGYCPTDHCGDEGVCDTPYMLTCESPHPIESLPFQNTGDTNGAPIFLQQEADGCPNTSATLGKYTSEHVYLLTTTDAAFYSFAVTAESSFDASIYLLNACGNGVENCIWGVDQVFSGGGVESFEIFLEADQTVFVVVDGYYSSTAPEDAEGSYQLDIIQLCTPDCEGRVCGADGCGGLCGICGSGGELCDIGGQCITDPGPGSCEYSQEIGPLPYTVIGSNEDSPTDYQVEFGDCLGYKFALGNNSPDRVYKLNASSDAVHRFSLLPSFFAALYLTPDCSGLGENCLAAEFVSYNKEKVTYANLNSGDTLYAVVDGDGYGEGDQGEFSLTVDTCGGSCGACSGALELPGLGIFEQEIRFFNNDMSLPAGSCPGQEADWGTDARDIVYRFEAPSTGSYNFTLVSHFDGALYVVNDCTDPAGSCVVGSENQYDVAESVKISLPASQVVYLVVDNMTPLEVSDGSKGVFTIIATQVESSCSDGIDDDSNGLTDCNDSYCAGDPDCGASSWPQSWTCAQVRQCKANCSDATCSESCAAHGSQNALTLLAALDACSSGAGCGDTDCENAQCPESLAACIGTENACTDTCGDGQTCVDGICQHTVTGSVQFEVRLPLEDLTGLAEAVLAPADGLLVVGTIGSAVLGSTLVQPDGSFSLPLAAPPEEGTELILVAADIGEFGGTIQPKWAVANLIELSGTSAPIIWAWSRTLGVGETDVGTINITEEEGSGAINIFTFVLNARNSTEELLGPAKETMAAVWTPGSTYGSGAHFSSKDIQIGPPSNPTSFDGHLFLGGSPKDPVHWSRFVIGHEFGHQLLESYSVEDSPGGTHYFTKTYAPTLAYSEGWANFVGVVLQGDVVSQPVTFSVYNGSAWWYNLETLVNEDDEALADEDALPDPTGPMSQNLNEVVVAAFLWDLWDPPNDDSIELGATTFSVVTQARILNEDLNDSRGYEGVDLVDYLDALMCLGTAAQSDVESCLHGFPYDFQQVCE